GVWAGRREGRASRPTARRRRSFMRIRRFRRADDRAYNGSVDGFFILWGGAQPESDLQDIPCSGEAAREARCRLLRRGGRNAEAGADFVEVEAVDAEAFLAGFFAGDHGDGAAGEAERVGEEVAEFVVGAAFERGCVDLDFEGVAEPADDLVAGRVGDGLDGDRAGAGHGENQSRASARAARMSATGSQPTERRRRSGSMWCSARVARPVSLVTRS